MSIPTITYPDIVAQFAGMLGGVETLVAGTSPVQHMIRVGSVRDIDLSDVKPIINDSESNARIIDLFSLSDNTVVRGYFWYVFSSDISDYALQAKAYLVKKSTGAKKDTEGAHPAGDIAMGVCNQFQAASYGANLYCARPQFLQTYKAKLILTTEYYNDTINPDGFGVELLLPTYNTLFPATVQSYSHVIRNFYGHSDGTSWDTAQGGDFYYPFRGAGVNVLWISNLTHFSNWVKDYDSSFNINDIMDIGETSDEPVQDTDPSNPGGGGGNFDGNSDPVDFPALPTGGALASGACKAYEVAPANLKSIFSKLWSSSIFDLSTFQRLVDNPMDCIISLHAIPVSPTITAPAQIYIGNFNTEVSDNQIGNQYLTIDCGSLDVKEFWGSALDYNPYTKSEIYLPFVGVKDLDTDDIMNKTVHIKYNIDVLNGDCIANIKCGQSVLYKFSGNIKQDIPVTGKTANTIMNAVQGAFSAFAGGLMGGAVGGPVGAAIAGGAGLSAAAGVVGSKNTTQRASNMSGNYGILDDFTPYLILHRPIQSLADKFRTFKGYPSNITAKLSSVTGYTEVEHINLQNIPNATSEEMDEIKSLLQSGVII